MATHIEIGDIRVEVVRKDIKNIHLSVYPPCGAVRIATPLRMDLDTIRVFAISKLGWIKKQQQKLRTQEREAPREYLDRESHYVWGKRYLLEILEKEAAPHVEMSPSRLILQIRPDSDEAKKRAVLDEWYRAQLKDAVPALIEKWESLLGVKVERFFVQSMKTRWGSCTHSQRTLRLNTELAKKPRECLEYIIVHEMMHLLEPTHNKHFIALMNHYLPLWQAHKDLLNRLPVRHEDWDY